MPNVAAYKPSQPPKSFWETVGIPARGIKLHEALHAGLPYKVYTNLAEIAGIDRKALAQSATIAPATLQRRAKAGVFTTDESDRLYRFAEVYNASLNLFNGERQSAQDWIQKPVRGLGNKRPIDLLTTSAETESVLNLIGCLEHGIFV
jgi:putative toxin-antitoxin system antitoxin component (TIGR02293 family)